MIAAAVSGGVFISDFYVSIDVDQSNFTPERHVVALDGPDGVEQFKKDLAFALYAVPEPSGFVLMLDGMCMVLGRRHRRMHMR